MAQVPAPQQYNAQQADALNYSAGQQAAYPGQTYPAGMENAAGAMNVPGQVYPDGQVYGGLQNVAVQPQYVGAAPGYGPVGSMYNPSPGGVVYNPNQAQQFVPPPQPQQPQYVGIPPGMTRASMQPGYGPGGAPYPQRGFLKPQWSFRDSFGNTRNKCCTIS